jgi:hypothetical protein
VPENLPLTRYRKRNIIRILKIQMDIPGCPKNPDFPEFPDGLRQSIPFFPQFFPDNDMPGI